MPALRSAPRGRQTRNRCGDCAHALAGGLGIGHRAAWDDRTQVAAGGFCRAPGSIECAHLQFGCGANAAFHRCGVFADRRAL